MKAKKIIVILLFNIIQFNANSQNIKKYYDCVNKAELKVCDNKLKEALRYYKESFNYSDNPFTHDLYNAFICSVKLKQIEYRYYKKIRERGVSVNFFKINSKVNALVIDSLENYRPIFITENKYKDTLNEMWRFDQLFRGEKDGYSKYADTIKKINEQNGLALIKLVQEKGFPSESLIGNDSNNIILSPFYSMIIHHAKGAHFQSVNFNSILEKAIKDGKIDNRLGTTLIDFSNGTEVFGNSRAGIIFYYYEGSENKDSVATWAQVANHKWYAEPITKKELKNYNKNRTIYYLDNVKDYKKKIHFFLSHPEYNFCLYSYKSIFGMAVKEEYDYIMLYLKEIK